MFKATFVALIVFLSGCASVPVTPRRISGIEARSDEAMDALKRWNEAVQICNEFLDSSYRKTLPKGEITLAEDGMVFATNDARFAINVRCGPAGDLLVPFKMLAQERADGFVVGALPPRKDREIDNSFFKHLSGGKQRNYEMAGLILHELTHSQFKTGTVSLTKTVKYYLEAIFLFRYRNHSMEALPFRTSREFSAFTQAHFKELERKKISP